MTQINYMLQQVRPEEGPEIAWRLCGAPMTVVWWRDRWGNRYYAPPLHGRKVGADYDGQRFVIVDA